MCEQILDLREILRSKSPEKFVSNFHKVVSLSRLLLGLLKVLINHFLCMCLS